MIWFVAKGLGASLRLLLGPFIDLKERSNMDKVIAGDFAGRGVATTIKGLVIADGFSHKVSIDSNTVKQYTMIEKESDVRKSAMSSMARGAVGGALLGPLGMLAGGLSAKNKKNSTYVVGIDFNDGKYSVLELGKNAFGVLSRACTLSVAGTDGATQCSETQELETSSAKQIKEYKDLLDAGIISQDEFDAKKKQLLNL